MYKTLILALALAAPAMATLPLILTTSTAAGVTTATTTLLAAPAVTGLLGAAVIVKGKKVFIYLDKGQIISGQICGVLKFSKRAMKYCQDFCPS